MNSLRIVIFLLLLQPVCSSAFLPPVEENTSREILEYRQRKKIEYSQERLEYEKQLVASRIQMEKAFAISPWKMQSGQIPSVRISDNSEETPWETIGRHLAVFSFMMLIPVLVIAFVLLRKMMGSERLR